MEPRPLYYAVRIGVIGALFVAGWAAFILLGNSWYQLFVAVFLAVLFTQIGFLGHEAGHRQIFRSRRANDLCGLTLGNLLIGLGFGWWTSKHNRHHANPNHLGKDPDIQIGAIAFAPDQARTRRGPARLLVRYQAYLFFPMLLLEAVNLHVASGKALLRNPAPRRRLEAVLLLTHAAAYLTVVFVVLSPLRAVAFIIVQQAMFGLYLGCAFAPNHKGMPVLEEADKLDFLRRQVLTSRNVRGGWFMENLLGGLNYQIEHHLFPSMPSPSLPRSQALVRAFCEQHGLRYCEKGIFGSFADVLGHLEAVGAATRPAEVT